MAVVINGDTGISPVTASGTSASVDGMTVGRGGGEVASNTAVGASALNANSTGANNTAVGYQSLLNNTANNNVAYGFSSLKANTSGTQNTGIGQSALFSTTTSSSNTAIGFAAMYNNTTGASNTAIGDTALQANTTASSNTAVGYQAGYTNSTGQYNTFVGTQAGYSSTGGENTCVGRTAGYFISTGTGNTFIGPGNGATSNGAGYYVTTGSKNSILGGYNGNQGGIDIRTSSNNIVLSDGDGGVKQWWNSTGYWEYTNNTQLRLPSTGGIGYIGYLADSSSIQISYNSGSNGVRLTSGATSWSTWSDQRLKNVTGTYTTPLADISQLQPIKFTWKSDEENKPQVGILAQSVQSVVPEAVEEGTISLEDETKYLTVRYTELIPLMVASIKELKTIVDAQAAEIAELKAK